MNVLYLSTILILYSINFGAVFSIPACPSDEVWNSCGSACTPTCSTPVISCTEQCVPRCECEHGKVKNADNICVPLDQCSKECPPDEVWNSCGSACTPTCENPNIPCTKQCVPRCECARGKVKNAKGICVLLKECPTDCGKFQNWGMANAGRCNTVTSKRARFELPTCPNGEEWSDCGSPCTPTCDDPHPDCTRNCVKRCQCPRGTVKNEENVCVPSENCSVCGPNEIWTQCGSGCQPTCSNPNPNPIAMICPAVCINCVCKSGYVRDENNRCIPIDECPDARTPCEFGTHIPGWHCGRGGERCPPGFNRLIHPTDRYAVCCPIRIG